MAEPNLVMESADEAQSSVRGGYVDRAVIDIRRVLTVGYNQESFI